MLDEAKAVLNLLEKRGFEAFYIGGKCRTDLHNLYHQDEKMQIHDIDIVTNATADEIKKIFPHHDEHGVAFSVVVVHFAENEFEIATYRKDSYDMAKVKRSAKIVKPTVTVAGSLDEDRARRDFTMNAVAQDVNNKYIDYTYMHKNKVISAMGDINNKIIRCIGDADVRFEEDPLRIIRLFRFVAQLGYSVEKDTLKSANKNKKLLEKIPVERFGPEFNKLLQGKYAQIALQMLKKFGFFKLKMSNGHKFFNSIQSIDDDYFEVLAAYNAHCKLPNILELYALLYMKSDDDTIRNDLLAVLPVNKLSIEKIIWIIHHFDLTESKDLHNDIFKARDGIIKDIKQPGMCELIKHIAHLYKMLYYTDASKARAKEIYDAFCSKPYFGDQLRITGDELMEYTGKGPGKWIEDVKEDILHTLLNMEVYPHEYSDYMDVVRASLKKVIGDIPINIPDEEIRIDIYGNAMDPQKASQFKMVTH